jgi:hypothetical protein
MGNRFGISRRRRRQGAPANGAIPLTAREGVRAAAPQHQIRVIPLHLGLNPPGLRFLPQKLDPSLSSQSKTPAADGSPLFQV